MSDKCFVTVWGLQKAEIEHYCFTKCGKALFSIVMDEQFGGLSPCNEVNCPYLEKEMDEPFGEMQGDLVYLRKLKEWKE